MAVTFSLAVGGTTWFNLDTAWTASLDDTQYVPVVATPTGDGSIPPYVTETIPVVLRCASHDDLALATQVLVAIQKHAAEYWVDQQQSVPVWLQCKLHAETGERRALVKRIDWEFRPDIEGVYRDCAGVQDYLVGTILIERHPYWERPTSRICPNSTPAAAAAVAYNYTAASGEMLVNPGFETVAAGPDWADWTEAAGDGALADEGVIVNTGDHACKITAGTSCNTYVAQGKAVAPNQTYVFFFYARGDGTNSGYYGIYDVTNTAWITTIRTAGVTAAAYQLVTHTFTTPADCIGITVYLHCSATDTAVSYFDDAGLYYQSHDIVGDVPARVNALGLRCGTGGAALLYRAWLGIRSADKHGATGVTAFRPVWECEDGIFGGDISEDAVTERDTASPGSGAGSYLQVIENLVDWDDGTFRTVVYMPANSIGYAVASDAYGRFLWLLRSKVTAGTWEVRMRMGTYATARNYLDPVKVSGTDWDYLELGVATIPPRNTHALDTTSISVAADLGSAIWLQARRTAGAGNLHVDCVCTVPVDEGFLKIWDAGVSNTQDTVFGQGPAEAMQTLDVVSGPLVADITPFEMEAFRLPLGDGRIICVYARQTTSVLTDQVEFADPALVTSSYTERWTALRGAE